MKLLPPGKIIIIVGSAIFFFLCSFQQSYAATSRVKPIFALKGEFDDNIFLTPTDESGDFITTLAAGVNFTPKLKIHEFATSYMVDFEIFADNAGQNTINHTLDVNGVMNFNHWKIEAGNVLRRFESRSGNEDTVRVPRTSDRNNIKFIYLFNKLNVGIDYGYRYENYRSDEGIGNFNGQALTYQDLDSDENYGEVELEFKFWPKTSMLFSGRYGAVQYDTGRKSDSDYFDILTGLRGEFLTKGEIEGKIGYRWQDYEAPGDDFKSTIIRGTLTERFTERDRLTINIDRIANPTIYQNNAYVKSTNIGGVYAHDFNNRIMGRFKGAYILNRYPTETTEGAETAKREDDLWSVGTGLSYQLSKHATMDFDYTYAEKLSNFDGFDYSNNRFSAAMSVEF